MVKLTHEIEKAIDSFLMNQVAKNTRRAYLGDLSDFFQFCNDSSLDLTSFKDLTLEVFVHYRDYLTDRNLVPTTLHRKLVCLRSLMNFALSQGYISHNPLIGLKLPKIAPTQETQALDDEEVVKIMDQLEPVDFKKNLHFISLQFLFYLGLRRSELGQIKIKDIKEERNHLILSVLGKGGKRRRIPLPPKLQESLQIYLDKYREFTAMELDEEDYLLQSNQKEKNTKPINGSTIYRMVIKYAKSAGITKHISPHSLRATAITHLLDTHSVHLREVADFAGHTNITTTEKYDKRRNNLDKNPVYKIRY